MVTVVELEDACDHRVGSERFSTVKMATMQSMRGLSLIDESLHISIQLVTAVSMNLFSVGERHYKIIPSQIPVFEILDTSGHFSFTNLVTSRQKTAFHVQLTAG